MFRQPLLRGLLFVSSLSLLFTFDSGCGRQYGGYYGTAGNTSGTNLAGGGNSGYQTFGNPTGSQTGNMPTGGSVLGNTLAGGNGPTSVPGAIVQQGGGNTSGTNTSGTNGTPPTAPTDNNGNPQQVVTVAAPSLLEHSPGCGGPFDHYGNNVRCPVPPNGQGHYYATGGGAQCQQPPGGGMLLDNFPLMENGVAVGWHIDCCSSESPGKIPQFDNAIYVVCAYSST